MPNYNYIPCNRLFKESLWLAKSWPNSAKSKLLLRPPCTTDEANLSLAPTWNDLSWSLSAGMSIRAWINGKSKVYNGLRCIAIKSKNLQRGATSPKTTASLLWGPPRFPISLIGNDWLYAKTKCHTTKCRDATSEKKNFDFFHLTISIFYIVFGMTLFSDAIHETFCCLAEYKNSTWKSN